MSSRDYDTRLVRPSTSGGGYATQSFPKYGRDPDFPVRHRVPSPRREHTQSKSMFLSSSWPPHAETSQEMLRYRMGYPSRLFGDSSTGSCPGAIAGIDGGEGFRGQDVYRDTNNYVRTHRRVLRLPSDHEVNHVDLLPRGYCDVPPHSRFQTEYNAYKAAEEVAFAYAREEYHQQRKFITNNGDPAKRARSPVGYGGTPRSTRAEALDLAERAGRAARRVDDVIPLREKHRLDYLGYEAQTERTKKGGSEGHQDAIKGIVEARDTLLTAQAFHQRWPEAKPHQPRISKKQKQRMKEAQESG